MTITDRDQLQATLDIAENNHHAVVARRGTAAAAVSAAEQNRKSLAVAAALGDAGAARKLRAATIERNDAVQLVEDIDAAIAAAAENVHATRRQIVRCDTLHGVARLKDILERRVGAWRLLEDHMAAMFIAYQELEDLGASAFGLSNALSGEFVREVAPDLVLEDMRNFIRSNRRRFANFLHESIPEDVRQELPEFPLTPRGCPSRQEERFAALINVPTEKEDRS